MAFFDLPPEKLKTYRAPNTEPADFDEFWQLTLAQAREHPLEARFVLVDDPIYKLVRVYDVSFNGYGGQSVRGWFIEPILNTQNKLPCLVTYIGYGGGRSLPVDHLSLAMAGIANFVMDTRGQGSVWAHGDTPDPEGSGPQYPGFMTRGIEAPATYYYRRVFTDAVRAIEAAATHPCVDPQRLGVTGVSQGGGITIAAAGLAGQMVKLAMADVPYLCHYRRATTLVDSAPYSEIALYLKTHRGRSEQVYKTLAYFDGVNFAPRITARCLFSVGLMDTVCPPSTVYAAYNRIKMKKKIRIYEFNNHEGGGSFQVACRLEYAVKHL